MTTKKVTAAVKPTVEVNKKIRAVQKRRAAAAVKSGIKPPTVGELKAIDKTIQAAMESPVIKKIAGSLKNLAVVKKAMVVTPTPKAKFTKAERAAAKKDAAKAAKVTKAIKASMAKENPMTPLTQLLTKAGFVYAKSEAVDERTTAHGYTHPDGSAALFAHADISTDIAAQWTVKRPDGSVATGKTAKELAAALYAPALPANTMSAVEMLHKATKGLCRLNDLAGDGNYKVRLQLLKKLLNTDKVLVKQSGVNNLIKAFYEVLKVPAASAAAMALDFENKCQLLYKQSRKADHAVRKVEAAEVKEVMKRTASQCEVHDGKPILPGVKKLSAKKQAEKDAQDKVDLAAQIARKRRQEEYTPIAVPRPEATIAMDLADICLLEDPNNGIVLMCLEKPNSQGAICVYNNGSRVAVGVVPTEILISLRPLVSEDLIRDVNQLLHPITAGVLVTPQAEQQLTAVLDYCKENIVMTTATETVKTKKFAPPAGATKKVASKSAKAEKPAKAAKAPKAAKTPRVTEDKKIKALVTMKSEGLPREGSFCFGQVEAIIGSKTVSEAQAKLDKSKLNPSGRKLEVAWLVKKGYLQVAA